MKPSRLALPLAFLAWAGCPEPTPPPAPSPPYPDASAPADATTTAPPSTHQGTISIQDRSLHGVPQAGHGLSVLLESSAPWRRPDFDEMPGSPAGCKVWLFDVASDPPPAAFGDLGVVTIAGTSAPVPSGCWLENPGATVCPAVTGSGHALLRHGGAGQPPGTAVFEVDDPRFAPDDRGRHLAIAGDPAGNDGVFPILQVLGPTALLLRKPAAADSDGATTRYRTLAGAGTTPGMPHEMPGDPLLDGDRVTVGIRPGGGTPFRFPDTAPIAAGGSFSLDTASAERFTRLPLDGSAFTLGCGGAGGTCAPAEVSILRILATDGSTEGLAPFAMPPAEKHQLEVSCAEVDGDGVVEVPAAVSDYLRMAHQQRPLTRIRTAFMRNGYAFVSNPPPLPANPVRIVAGHQVLGFQDP